MHISPGLYEEIRWDNTPRKTKVFIVPSTREKNKSNSEEEVVG
jgi:hypothetical protein